MTNEQAIAHFKEQLEVFGGEHHEAMKVAIEALENQNSCKDCAGCTQWLCECANVRAEVCDRIVEQLEEELRLSEIEKRRCVAENAMQFDSAKGYYNGIDNALAIVKGVQDE